jgi:hypothetical protein
MRFNRASNLWNFELTLRNTALRRSLDRSSSWWTSTTNTSGAVARMATTIKASLGMTARVNPRRRLVTGLESSSRTLALDSLRSSQCQPDSICSGSTTGTGLAFVRTLNEFGQPLPAVEIAASGPSGAGTNSTDSSSGCNAWIWRRHQLAPIPSPGYLPVWRQQTLIAGTVVEIPSPRLLRRGPNPVQLGPGGGVLTNQAVIFESRFRQVRSAETQRPAHARNRANAARKVAGRLESPAGVLAGIDDRAWLTAGSQFDLWDPIRLNEKAALATGIRLH